MSKSAIDQKNADRDPVIVMEPKLSDEAGSGGNCRICIILNKNAAEACCFTIFESTVVIEADVNVFSRLQDDSRRVEICFVNTEGQACGGHVSDSKNYC